MIKVTVDDKTKAALAEVKAVSFNAIKRMVLFAWTTIQNELSVSNPRPYTTPSAPGSPPRKRTGFGAANVRYELDEKAQEGRIGVAKNAAYMAYLDQGTATCGARPWLLATILKILPQLKALATAKK